MSHSQQKKTLRKELLERRNSIGDEQYRRWSKAIIDRLEGLELFREARTIHCYLSINERKEVNTLPLARKMIDRSVKLVVPITIMEDLTLEHVELKSFENVRYNEWGVPEPTGGETVPVSELDLVVVPMVGGDEEGNRMGYGKGFYDRFLKEVDCPKIGLCFERCMVESLPVNSHDVPLDGIITEKRVIK